jgi:Flp pilus assembly pilin Flp
MVVRSKRFARRRQRRGVLALEWILLITIVVVGIIGGLGAVRLALINEAQDLNEAMQSLNVKSDSECMAETESACP